MLARPVSLALRAHPATSGQRGPPPQTTRLSAFECIPVELLKLIIEDTELEKGDIVALGLCSSTLWKHVVDHVGASQHKESAPWAGAELAILGNYLTELPKTLNEHNLALRSVKITIKGQMPLARKFYWSAKDQYEDEQNAPLDTWVSAMRLQYHKAQIPPRCWAHMEGEISYDKLYPSIGPRGECWVLRNTTTQEYVRLQAGPGGASADDSDDSEANWRRIVDVLLMRICWTSDGYYSYYPDAAAGETNINPGSWAGHCFDIVMLGAPLSRRDGWQDITKDIVNDAKQLRQELRPTLEHVSAGARWCSAQ